MTYKLGKKPPKRDPRTPRLEKYLRPGAAEAHALQTHVLFASERGTNPVATSLTEVSGIGTVGASDTLTAVLTANGSPIGGETVFFQFPDQQPRPAVFHARTNQAGVAVVTGIPAPKHVGTFRILATYKGNWWYAHSKGTGTLVVVNPPAPPNPSPPTPPTPTPTPPTPDPTPPAPTPIPPTPNPGPLPTPPTTEDLGAKVTKLGMMDNDTVGDCTCACAGHMVQAWTANCGNQVIIPDAAILSAYEAVSGYVPGLPSTDVGANCEDVLAYWKNTGIGSHFIVGYASVDVTNQSQVEDSVYLFGGIYLGVNMPISAQNQTGPGLVWDVPPGGAIGDGEPGSWGGHAVPIVAYDAAGLTVITWGALQRMSWAFLTTYCDEAYAVLSQDWIETSGLSPDNFDFASLQADMALI